MEILPSTEPRHETSLILQNTLISVLTLAFYLILKVIVGDADSGKGKFLAALLGKKKLDPGKSSLLTGPKCPHRILSLIAPLSNPLFVSLTTSPVMPLVKFVTVDALRYQLNFTVCIGNERSYLLFDQVPYPSNSLL